MLILPATLLFLNGLALQSTPDYTVTEPGGDTSADDDAINTDLTDTGDDAEYLDKITQINFEQDSKILAIHNDFVFEDVFYEMDIEVGSPPQLIAVRLDTSSSDLYLNGDTNSYTPFFDLMKSDTFETLNSVVPFRLSIANESLLTGRWVKDIVKSLGHTIECQFAVLDSDGAISTLGLGLKSNEFASNFLEASHKEKEEYPNFCQMLKNLGKIQRNGYSIWLDGLSYNSGLLYGAVDHSKYEGFLMKVPIHDLYAHALGYGAKPKKLAIILDFISATSGMNDYLIEIRKPVVLDTSSAISYLPETVIGGLGFFFNGNYIPEAEMYVVDCDLKGEISFEFSGISFSINIREFVLPLYSRSSPNKCYLPMKKREFSDHVLGNAFLKELYMVVDLDAYEIALAKVIKMSSGKPKPDDIEIMSTGIPRAIDALFYDNTHSLTLTYSTIFGY